MFEVNVNGRKQRYRSKPTMNVDTTGSSGDVSIPKPLTYDYMPEGYPSKRVENLSVTIEPDFEGIGDGTFFAELFGEEGLELVAGQTYAIVWDGVEYACVGKELEDMIYIGNAAIDGVGENTSEPFVLFYEGDEGDGELYNTWRTNDDASKHTISYTKTVTNYTVTDVNFLPTAAETTPGICTLSQILEAVRKKYHTVADTTVSNASKLDDVIKEAQRRYLGLGIILNGEYAGQIVTGTSLASGVVNAICAKQSSNSISAYEAEDLNIEKVWELDKFGVTIMSSTPGSAKKFKITVDDSGTISATEVT